jgi:hypothetical protein
MLAQVFPKAQRQVCLGFSDARAVIRSAPRSLAYAAVK